MTLNEYQNAAVRTVNFDTDLPKIINGVLGLTGESGECADIIKKHYFQGHDFDINNFVKELGDVAWYLAYCAWAINVPLDEICRRNIEKLKKRYPDGFDSFNSLHREENDT